MNLIATLTREAFNEACAALCQEDADVIAETYPNLFAAYFTYNARAADVRPAPTPGPVKAREPKASPTVDKGAAASAVFAYVRAFPNVRAEEVEVTAPDGMDAKAWNRMLRGILEKFVTDGKMYADGERRGRRYKVAVKATEPEVAAE